MTNWLNDMSTDVEPANTETVIRSFDRRLRKLRYKHLLLRGKHWRTIKYHKGLLRENHRKLQAIENYANDLLNCQSPIHQGVGHLLKEMVSSDSDSFMSTEVEKRTGCDFCDEEAVDYSYLKHPDDDYRSSYYTCLEHSKLTEKQLVEILKVGSKEETKRAHI